MKTYSEIFAFSFAADTATSTITFEKTVNVWQLSQYPGIVAVGVVVQYNFKPAAVSPSFAVGSGGIVAGTIAAFRIGVRSTTIDFLPCYGIDCKEIEVTQTGGNSPLRITLMLSWA